MEGVYRYLPVVVVLIVGLQFGCSHAQTARKSKGIRLILYQHPQCPTWFFWKEISHECKCGPDIGVVCNQAEQRIWIRQFRCMTYDNGTDSTVVAVCPFSDVEARQTLVPIPQNKSELNEAMCGKTNREGPLCSKCKSGYGPAVLSYDYRCAKCSDSYFGWFLYLSFALIPTTVFFLVIVLCQVRTTSAPLNLFVLVCQVGTINLASYPHEFVSYSEKSKIFEGIATTFFTLWNLDFFQLLIPPFCMSENLSNLQVLCIDYIVAFYPLLLTAIMYICIQQHARGCRILVCLWRPFAYCFAPLVRRFNWNPATSIVPVFASFLLLSSTKILFVSFSLLHKGEFYNLTRFGVLVRHTNVLYYDPNLAFFGQKHLPYALLAIFVSTTFVLLPSLLLCLYPTRVFQKCLNCCGIRWFAIHAFADAFNGCYKDGTKGTRDYRCFAGLYLILRIVCIMIVNMLTSNAFHKILSIATLFIFVLASPYKNRLFNVIDGFGLTLIALRICIPEYKDVFNTISGVYLLVYFVTYLSCKLILKLNCQCSRKLKTFADKVSGNWTIPHIEREAVGVEDRFPDRVVNPEGYRLLSEVDDEPQTLNTASTTPTYGSMQ